MARRKNTGKKKIQEEPKQPEVNMDEESDDEIEQPENVPVLDVDTILSRVSDFEGGLIDAADLPYLLFQILESIIARVGFDDETVKKCYLKVIEHVGITDTPIEGDSNNQNSAFVASIVCLRAKQYGLFQALISALIKAIRLHQTQPITEDEVISTLKNYPEMPESCIIALHNLADEILQSEVRERYLQSLDNFITDTGEDFACGFGTPKDLLENMAAIDKNNPKCRKQVGIMLEYIFDEERDLIMTHGKNLAKLIDDFEKCPGTAIPCMEILVEKTVSLLEAKRNCKNTYVLLMICLKHIDVSKKRVQQALPDIMAKVMPMYDKSSRILADMLDAFENIHHNSAPFEDFRAKVAEVIFEQIRWLLDRSLTYEQHGTILDSLTILRSRATAIPIDILEFFIKNSQGTSLGTVNRALGLVNDCSDLKKYRPMLKQSQEKKFSPIELKADFPNVYRFIYKDV